jgi:hypothetical protein
MRQCAGCGERLADSFDICWNCGTNRDGKAPSHFQREADDPTVSDPGPSPDDLEHEANHDVGVPVLCTVRWYQYRLRTVLLIVLACSILCSWFALRKQKASRQKEAVAAIKALEGDVFYDYQFDLSGRLTLKSQPSTPLWLRERLGDDFFNDVHFVGLESSKITDAEIEHVKCLTNLRWLRLNLSAITDEGLPKLNGLSRLEKLFIEDTKVTEDGVKRLQQALPNCKIYWSSRRDGDGPAS